MSNISSRVPRYTKWCLVSLFALGVLFGCEEPALRPGTAWVPKTIGGPAEIRPLPPANQLRQDYSEWLAVNTNKIVRFYEVVLTGATNQMNFRLRTVRGETPLGRPWVTFVTFTYDGGTNGYYDFVWHYNGHQKEELLRLQNKPKRLLVFLQQTRDVDRPKLAIRAIEGIEARHAEVAINHDYVP